ncbi:unnamed protein product [Polarella glacialis]|uniref:Uncharacterized protein n=1 Tax=Polarella glacialis TaxID=89957 RepID=A0A813IKT8_POLGL|nr:unnamed protein product [Polarella glacialis]
MELDVRDCKASRPEDVEAVLATISDIDAFNGTLHNLILNEKAGLLKAQVQLHQMIPAVREANCLAAGLSLPLQFDVRMKTNRIAYCSESLAVCNVIINGTTVWEWTPETFLARVPRMRVWAQRSAGSLAQPANLDVDGDPFWDSFQEEVYIGTSVLFLSALAYQMDSDERDLRIVSYRGDHVGRLHASYRPTAEDGKTDIPEDEQTDEPEELLGTKMTIVVTVHDATVPEDLANDVLVEYDFSDDSPHRVPPVTGKHCSPVFNFEKVHVKDSVTPEFLKYLDRDGVEFRVYGRSASIMALKQKYAAAPVPASAPVPTAAPAPAAAALALAALVPAVAPAAPAADATHLQPNSVKSSSEPRQLQQYASACCNIA